MAKIKRCKCSHREDQHLPDTVKRQGSKEEWNSTIKYKGQCAVCDPSGAFACLKFREDKGDLVVGIGWGEL